MCVGECMCVCVDVHEFVRAYVCICVCACVTARRLNSLTSRSSKGIITDLCEIVNSSCQYLVMMVPSCLKFSSLVIIKP